MPTKTFGTTAIDGLSVPRTHVEGVSCVKPQHTWTNYSVEKWDYQSVERSVTDRFRERQSKGEILPFNFYRKYSVVGTATGNYAYSKTGVYCASCPNYAFGTYYAPRGWSALQQAGQAYASAIPTHLQAAAAKIYGQYFDALTFIAEFRKLEDQFLGLGARIKYLLAKPWSTWLEVRYAWRTLWYDVEDLVKAINHVHDGRTRFRERAGDFHQYTENGVLSMLPDNGAHHGVTLQVSRKITVKTGAAVIADAIPPKFQFNLPNTVWEEIPYSWVVDWYLHIGNYLQSLGFLGVTDVWAGAGSYIVECESTFQSTTPQWYSGWTGDIHASGTIKEVFIERTPMSSLPRLPTVSLQLNLTRIMDLVSLAYQALFQKGGYKSPILRD